MIIKAKEKKERALGEKLGLKAERCSGAKCAMMRRPHRPGVHGKSFKKVSEYGQQLMEKQKFIISYGLTNDQLKKVIKEASKKVGTTQNKIIELLERRLDNVVYRAGLAGSRSVAKKLINQGHIIVDGKKVRTASFQVSVGDIVGIRTESKTKGNFKGLEEKLKNFELPYWINVDKEKNEAKIVALPQDIQVPFNINLVVEFYSK